MSPLDGSTGSVPFASVINIDIHFLHRHTHALFMTYKETINFFFFTLLYTHSPTIVVPVQYKIEYQKHVDTPV